MKTKNMMALQLRKSMGLSPLRRGLLLIAVTLACFRLSPMAQAVTPAPDGGYANGNTAEGTNALFSLTTGVNNTAVGFDALFHGTTGNANVADGFEALFKNTTGSANTATGFQALYSNTTGIDNTAAGFEALFSNTTGVQNAAGGYQALFSNTTGLNNTASGFEAVFSNTTGKSNTATGSFALFSNTIGNENTATGSSALPSNTTGSDNTASGFQALSLNTSGSFNTADGFQALALNTTGSDNTAVGVSALTANKSGIFNTAVGLGALQNNTIGENNTAIGATALNNNTTGSDNIALGDDAGHALTTGDNNIDIGNLGVAGESGTIRIGTTGSQTSTFIAGISGIMVTGTTVVVNGSGQLGVATSSARYKEDIHSMDRASEAILALKPVTFHYKKKIDPASTTQFGLVAEQVEKVNPDLVVRDSEGKVFTVRYEAVNAMLLNEFLKEHKKVEKQEATITELRKDFQSKLAEQQNRINALALGLEKVTAQLDLSKAAPQTVLNNP